MGSSATVGGVVAAGVGLGSAELVAGLVPSGRSPVAAVANWIIDASPGAVSRAVIDALGTNDKPFLVVSIVVVVLALGGLAGRLHARRPALARLLVGVAALLGAAALLADHEVGGYAVLAPLAGGLATLPVLGMLGELGDGRPYGPLRPEAMGRRAFLVTGVASASAAAAGAAIGRPLQRHVDAAASRALVVLPAAATPLAAASGPDFRIDGLSPWTTPNGSFYRIDTALIVPQVRAEDWTLRIHGMVDHEIELSFEELLARPQVEADVTLACVSNGVGGDLVGNARWLGVSLPDLLREAGVHPGADQVLGRSVDGFTAGFPTTAAFDGRDALVAVGMNGEALPVKHGFPARLVVGGLYGYVSATKWLKEIELTTFAGHDAYWIQRGWAQLGPVKVMSRIDRPRSGKKLDPGDYVVAGMAWAQGRGIAKVEVRVDSGRWQEAELGEAVGNDTWRQWRLTWPTTPGRHILTVRATTEDGELQSSTVHESFPDGATGWHQSVVEVRR
jgi:DMSO/TMAO reductase YedYZ molybdopterin-dependent catalytic subunit